MSQKQTFIHLCPKSQTLCLKNYFDLWGIRPTTTFSLIACFPFENGKLDRHSSCGEWHSANGQFSPVMSLCFGGGDTGMIPFKKMMILSFFYHFSTECLSASFLCCNLSFEAPLCRSINTFEKMLPCILSSSRSCSCMRDLDSLPFSAGMCQVYSVMTSQDMTYDQEKHFLKVLLADI